MFEDTTDRDKQQLREILELDRMYQGRALRGTRVWRDVMAALVTALLIVEAYAILLLSECWWGCWT